MKKSILLLLSLFSTVSLASAMDEDPSNRVNPRRLAQEETAAAPNNPSPVPSSCLEF